MANLFWTLTAIYLYVHVDIHMFDTAKCEYSRKYGLLWNYDADNSNTSIDLNDGKKLCSKMSSCFGMNVTQDVDMPVQYYPLLLQQGTTLQFSITYDLSNRSNITIYKADKESFISCDVNKSVIVMETTSTQQIITVPPIFLQVGHNYFIISDGQLSCNQGNRVNVTVRSHACSTTVQNVTCSNKGYCVALPIQPVYTCTCCPGYTGSTCEITEVNFTSSTPSIPQNDVICDINCLNGGTCLIDEISNSTSLNMSAPVNSSTKSSSRCVCRSPFTGSHCERHLDNCKSNPCVNGVCVEKSTGYQCYCIPGYHGRQCELEYNECLSRPCGTGGTCVDRIDKYECHCTKAYSGLNCEIKADMCDPNPCHVNASCTNKADTYHCTCPPGLTGHACSLKVDECKSNPCRNDGTCVDLDNGYECLCPLTFAGVQCEYMMDVFAPPLEDPELTGEAHKHNLYIVAGTLSGAIVLVIIVLVACYCKMHDTYKHLQWRRMRYKKRSLSCPDLDSYSEVSSSNKPRLSVDAVWEATSLCYNNASFDTPMSTQRI